jgi:hypothetical protein
VRKAAAAYQRLLIRVPEAYLLLRHYETIRPGLLVLDADGRRVTSIDLNRALSEQWKPADVAKKLDEARTAPALAHIRLQIDGGEKEFREAVAKLPGIRKAVVDTRGFAIVAEHGKLTPERVAQIAAKTKTKVTWIEPVRVRLERVQGSSDVIATAGLWHVTPTGKGVAAPGELWGHVYATRLLLDKPQMEAGGFAADLEMRTFDILDVPKGGLGARVAAAPLKVEGVLAVRPDIFGDTEIVIGRKGAVDWDKVLAAFREAGCPDTEPAE